MPFTAHDVPALDGKTAIVTGSNSGIGMYTALELARHGADVTLACRNIESATKTAEHIRGEVPDAQVSVAPLNLASLDSVTEFAAGWHRPLNLLINNAGVMAPKQWRPTEDGFELQFGTNHLGHYALTGRLLGSLLAAGDARVVTVSSLVHKRGDQSVVLGNPKDTYSPNKAYGNSKLANMLFGLELQRRGRGLITSTVAHPGVAATNLMHSPDGMGTTGVQGKIVGALAAVAFQSAAAGAIPTLYAATKAEPGSYSGPRYLGFRGPAVPVEASSTGRDTGLAAQLWDISEDLTGVSYDWPVDN